jgi:hypothetical protein
MKVMLIKQVSTIDMLADILTKPLGKIKIVVAFKQLHLINVRVEEECYIWVPQTQKPKHIQFRLCSQCPRQSSDPKVLNSPTKIHSPFHISQSLFQKLIIVFKHHQVNSI